MPTSRRPAFIPTGFPPPLSSSWPSPLPPSSDLSAPLRRRRHPPASIRLPPAPLRIPFPLFIQSVRIVGTKRVPKAIVHAAVADLVGRRATRERIFRALRAVDEWFMEKGYVASRVAVAAFPTRENGNALVVTSVEATLVSVRIEPVDEDGNFDEGAAIRTKESVVCRALGIRVGEIFRWKKSSFEKLIELGVFESASAELEFFGVGKVGVVVSVREAKTRRIEPGVGISGDGRSYGDLSVVDGNLFGTGQKLRVEWQRRLEMERGAGGVEWEDPRVGAKIPFALRGKIYRDANSERELPGSMGRERARGEAERDRDRGKNREGIMLEVGWKPGKDGRMRIATGPVVERIAVAQYGGVGLLGLGGSPEGVNQALWMANASLDMSEAAPVPRKGRRAYVEYAVGKGIRNGSGRSLRELFQRGVLRVAQYLPVGNIGSIAIGGTLGLGSENLPWHEQKALGGQSTVRGYFHGELGRSPSFAAGRIEVRVPLISAKEGAESTAESSREAESATNSPGQNKARGSEKEEHGVGATSSKQQKGASGKTKDRVDGSEGVGTDPDGGAGRTGFPNVPDVVGVIFADTASADVFGRQVVGSSRGLGLRIGGIVSVEVARAANGREPRLHFGIIDRSL